MRPQFAQTYVLLISVSPSLTFAAGQKSTLLVEHPQFWSDAECMSLYVFDSWYQLILLEDGGLFRDVHAIFPGSKRKMLPDMVSWQG